MEPKQPKTHKFDPSLFQKRDNDSSEDNAIKRLSNALKCYSDLDILNNDNDKNSFNHFIQEYNAFIDDFTILIKRNKQTLYEIQQSLIKNDGFTI